jgi:hypothetical protein
MAQKSTFLDLFFDLLRSVAWGNDHEAEYDDALSSCRQTSHAREKRPATFPTVVNFFDVCADQRRHRLPHRLRRLVGDSIQCCETLLHRTGGELEAHARRVHAACIDPGDEQVITLDIVSCYVSGYCR